MNEWMNCIQVHHFVSGCQVVVELSTEMSQQHLQVTRGRCSRCHIHTARIVKSLEFLHKKLVDVSQILKQ